jgi:IS30 family transposase
MEVTFARRYNRNIGSASRGDISIMTKNKHLTKEDRIVIEERLTQGESFKSIARQLGKDPTTISKEIRNHLQFRQKGCYGRPFNDCRNRMQCPVQHLCGNRQCNRFCRFCRSLRCSTLCPDYEQQICSKLSNPPYVCNGCSKKKSCTLEKRVYSAKKAQQEYEEVLSEARQGVQLTEEEALRLDTLISPLLKKGQSLHHIWVNHRDEIMVHKRSLYNYVAAGIFSARNLDMPRIVRMGKRKKKKAGFKVDAKCRIGRTYKDYLTFIQQQPGQIVVEMDTLEGRIGGKVLLTLHFTNPQFMLAFIRDANTSRSVTTIFDMLWQTLGADVFRNLFQVLLADNGSEFSNPLAIELDPQGQRRTRLFYCDPQASFQKGAVENNHSLLRRIVPKGTSFDSFNQDDICLMMNHINSYTRANLGDKSPYEVFADLYGNEPLRRLGAELIPSDEVTLRPSLLKR